MLTTEWSHHMETFLILFRQAEIFIHICTHGSGDCSLMMMQSSSHTYRQNNVAVTLVKAPIALLWNLDQLHFLLHSGNKSLMK